jgi:hypothetical protein
MARIAADRGYWLSFAGNVTFKNAQNLRDALADAARGSSSRRMRRSSRPRRSAVGRTRRTSSR